MIRLLAIFLVVLLVLRAMRALLEAVGATAPRPAGPRPTSPRPATRAAWDPWAVLGVARGADRAAIVHAYREQIKLYHPDRVAELGPELKRVAHEKTLELQRAYEELTATSRS